MIEAPPGGRGRVIGGGIGLGLLAGGGVVCARALLADPVQRDRAFWFGLVAWLGVVWLRAWWRRRVPGPEAARPPAAMAPSIALALVPGAMLAWYTSTDPSETLVALTILLFWLGILGLRSSRGIRRLETTKTDLPRWPLPVIVVLAFVPGATVLWLAVSTSAALPAGVILTAVGAIAVWLTVQERRAKPGAVGEPPAPTAAEPEPEPEPEPEVEPPLDPTLEEIAEQAERRGGGRER